MAEQWVCVFDGRPGARARAVFVSKEQARQFAERHAQAVAPSGMPLNWEDTNETTVLTTQLGDYLVAPVGEDLAGHVSVVPDPRGDCRSLRPSFQPLTPLLRFTRQRLESTYQALDPVRLLRQLETLQHAVWRHVVYRTHGTQVGDAHPRADLVDVTFKVTTCGLGVDGNQVGDDAQHADRRGGAPPTPHRKYRRTKQSLGPRTYHTRKDPFEAVWDEIRGWLEVEPERTVKSVFVQLQDKYPGQYPDCQLRTLRRQVAVWRAGVILTFDKQWLANDVLAGQPRPGSLRARAESRTELPLGFCDVGVGGN
jgi:hypothetical protein